jgi:hypothetical protein
MVQVNLESLNNQFLVNYLNFLTGRVFKILPISEQEPNTLQDYLSSLVIELKGSQSLIELIRYDANFISLISTLQYFVDNQYTHKVLKREVFKCIKLIQKLQKSYVKEE